MQDRAYRLRRIHLLRGWVNKGKREVRYLYSRLHREGSKSLTEGIRSSVVRPCGARFPVEVCPFAYQFVHILCGPDLQHRHLAPLDEVLVHDQATSWEMERCS
jgi:hypothetical protein